MFRTPRRLLLRTHRACFAPTSAATAFCGTAFCSYAGNVWPLLLALRILCALLAHSAAAADTAPKGPPWVPGYRVRFPVRLTGDQANPKTRTRSAVAQIPAAGYLRADGSDLLVQAADGELIPVRVISHNPRGDTLLQFKRQEGSDSEYWVYAGNPAATPSDAPLIEEGLSVEFREWEGESLASWAEVVAGLQKSHQVTANSWVDKVAQNGNGGRPDNPKKVVSSYRGWLRIEEEQTYKFYVGADDAAFLFIDGERVFEQAGGFRYAVRIPASAWVEVPLRKGLHSVEMHHVTGGDVTRGSCALYVKADGATKKLQASWVPTEMFAHATVADVLGIEAAANSGAAAFVWGIDDTLTAPGINLHLARFEAHGTFEDPNQLLWDFGDGTSGSGRSPSHVYFSSGEFTVTLKAPGCPPVPKRVYLWAAPSPTSPFSLARAVELLTTDAWQKWELPRINQLFDFLTVCEQPNRWPLVEQTGLHLLEQPDIDPKRRVLLHTHLIEAVARQGRSGEAIKRMEGALAAAGKIPSLRAVVLLKCADTHWQSLRDAGEAARLYEKITTEYRGLEVPAVREAAIHWGDLYAETGDLGQAAERYKLAKTLGGDGFAATGQTEAIQRGAQLRIAEQKLKSGDVRGTRLLLQKIELNFPEQKLEGLFRLLRAETERIAGRYEEAVGHYEVLLRLRQWAGFRDRAIHGLADCAFRQQDFKTAIEWLEKLRDSFPEYYETQKLQAVYTQARERMDGTLRKETFAGFATGFEPEQMATDPKNSKLVTTPVLGIDGPRAVSNRLAFQRDLHHFPAGNSCWVEFWYRKPLSSIVSFAVSAQLYEGSEVVPSKKTADILINLDRSAYGQWRKAAALLQVPNASDALLSLGLVWNQTPVHIDGLKILPVSDRQNDLLRNFIESGDAEP